MRRQLFVLLVLALPAAAASLEPYVVLVDWKEGRAIAPTTPFVTPPTADAFAFDAPECYPYLLLDLLYDPAELAADVPEVGEAAVSYEFRAEVWQNGTSVLDTRISSPGYGHPLGRLDDVGPHELRLSLGWGVDVEWELRLRGRLATEDPTCNPPV